MLLPRRRKDSRIEDGLAPQVTCVAILGAVCLWIVSTHEVLALSCCCGRGVDRLRPCDGCIDEVIGDYVVRLRQQRGTQEETQDTVGLA